MNLEEVRKGAINHLLPLFKSQESARKNLVSLPIKVVEYDPEGWVWLPLPDWASNVVPQEYPGLLVPNYTEIYDYENYPWWNAIDYYIKLGFEKAHENQYGSIHSYSRKFKIKNFPIFDFAWVNRIAAFLRLWASQLSNLPEADLFGAPSTPKIILTHDVDALDITFKLRIKQLVHRLLEFRFIEMLRIGFHSNTDNFIESLIDLENSYNFKSVWFIFVRSKDNPQITYSFLDPQYSLESPKARKLIQKLKESGHKFGLHGSFSSWNDTYRLHNERTILSNFLGIEINLIRQHWLKFSIYETWKAQNSAGLTSDFTLGFNDRMGFRASTSLPISTNIDSQIAISTLIMDSNLFSRKYRNFETRKFEIDRLLDEIESFGGHMAINWHPHTLSSCYGWKETYIYLLNSLKNRKIEVNY
jgi:hypothetical protein